MYQGQIVTPELSKLLQDKNRYLSDANSSYKSASGANAWDRSESKYGSDVASYKKNKKKVEDTDRAISELLANLDAVGKGTTTVGAMKQTSALTGGMRETSVLTSLI